MLCGIVHFNPIQLHHLHDAQFERKLGKGTFGKVKIYKCKEKDCNNTLCEQCFVIKTIKIRNNKMKFWSLFCNEHRKYIQTVNKRLKQILLNEWDIGKILDHPNVIKTLDVDIHQMSLILEYFESIDLFVYITNNIFEYPMKTKNEYSIEIFKQILNGVNYLHDSGIVHMDLKLENIIINPFTRMVKIIDFGKALDTKITGSTKLITKCEWGTTEYLPPECFEKNKNTLINLKSVDLWACGIIFYNIIYNSTPWSIACTNIDYRYNRFVKYIQYDILAKNIFPDLNYRCWSLYNISIINNLFKSFLSVNPDHRVTINDAIHNIDKINFI